MDFSGKNLKDLKESVYEAVATALHGIRDRYLRILAEDDGRYVDSVADAGAKKAKARAEENIYAVRKAIGLQ
jgi:hypothetical protein